MKFKSSRGYTLVELMTVVVILGVVSSMVAPRITQVLERAYEAKAKGQLGAVRSAIQIYYSNTEGRLPFQNEPDGVASDRGMNLSEVLAPIYLNRLPTPYLADHFTFVPGLFYDVEARRNMEETPPKDVVFVAGPPAAVLVNRPYVYDPVNGHIYYCNGNYAVAGVFYYEW
jgi:prepilin-type N-terminal cleavage/methylation domain-containing protein